jgi:uncharacterized membrane protein
MEKGLTVRRIVIAGVLGAIAILLGVTRLGYIPVPTAAGNATIMHIPAVIGGIMEGWGVGMIIGLIFGVSSFLNATVPLFKDPLVAILPRLFIGVTAYLTYVGLKNVNQYLAIGAAGFVGAMTNTILVLGMAVIRGYMPFGVGVRPRAPAKRICWIRLIWLVRYMPSACRAEVPMDWMPQPA